MILIISIILIILLTTLLYKRNFETKINIIADKISIIILNYNRPHNINRLVDHLLKLDFSDDIIISNGKPETTVIINHPFVTNEIELRNKYYSATRFELAKMAKNDIILFIDDDIIPGSSLINNMLNKISNDGLEAKHNLYGPVYRLCDCSGYKNIIKYNIVLTGIAMIYKHTAIKVWNKIKESTFYDILMENKGNGEDLLFAKYIELFGGKCIKVNGHFNESDNTNGYSSMDNHYKIRGEFCKKINCFNYGQLIPKIIHQTSYHKYSELPNELIENIKKMKEMNPDYEYRYYDNDDIIQFITNNYDTETLNLYNNINDCYGAAKADFFRYLLIYKVGGIYLDIKSSIKKPLNTIIKPYDEFLLTSWETKEWHTYNPIAFFYYQYNKIKTGFGEFTQWMVVSVHNHPFLKAVIEQCKNNLKNYSIQIIKEIGQNLILQQTGPIMYSNTILNILNNHNYTFKYNKYNDAFIYTIYDYHYIHRNKILTKNSYRNCDKPLMKSSI